MRMQVYCSIEEQIHDTLNALGIAFRQVEHPAAHTIQDCKWAEDALSALIPKNLFLTPRNQSAYYLCIVHPDSVFRTSDLSKQVPSSRLSFGPEDKLSELLQTYPGAISPMGLIFPSSAPVHLLIDERLKSIPMLAFHPNDNTKTLAISNTDFFSVFLPYTGHAPQFVHF